MLKSRYSNKLDGIVIEMSEKSKYQCIIIKPMARRIYVLTNILSAFVAFTGYLTYLSLSFKWTSDILRFLLYLLVCLVCMLWCFVGVGGELTEVSSCVGVGRRRSYGCVFSTQVVRLNPLNLLISLL